MVSGDGADGVDVGGREHDVTVMVMVRLRSAYDIHARGLDKRRPTAHLRKKSSDDRNDGAVSKDVVGHRGGRTNVHHAERLHRPRKRG